LTFFDVNGIKFSYRSKNVLDGVTFSICENDVVAILGPNGAGKTTLMKCLNRILVPDGGSVLIEGSDLHTMRSRGVSATSPRRGIRHG